MELRAPFIFLGPTFSLSRYTGLKLIETSLEIESGNNLKTLSLRSSTYAAE